MCSGPGDANRGAHMAEQLAREKITVWGDQFSTDTKTILTALDYCKIKYDFEVIETNHGELSDDQYAYHQIVSQSKHLKELVSTQNEIMASNASSANNNSKHLSISQNLHHQLIICDNQTFLEYVKKAKGEFKTILFGGDVDDSSEVSVEVRTHMIWFDQVLKPTSTRFTKAKIQDLKKGQHGMGQGANGFGMAGNGLDDLTRYHDELFEIVLVQLDKQIGVKKYLCTPDQITFPDIQYFVEIK